MAKIKFTKKMTTVKFGAVEVGDEVDTDADTADRYVTAGWADVVKPRRKKTESDG